MIEEVNYGPIERLMGELTWTLPLKVTNIVSPMAAVTFVGLNASLLFSPAEI